MTHPAQHSAVKTFLFNQMLKNKNDSPANTATVYQVANHSSCGIIIDLWLFYFMFLKEALVKE